MSALRLTFLLALLTGALAGTAACTVVHRWASQDESQRRASRMQEVQLKVMRYADDYGGRIRDPLESLKATATSPEERLAAHNWRIIQSSAAYTIASGANPVISALDMIVLATLSRMVVEDYQVTALYGAPAVPLLEIHRDLERQSWMLVDGVVDEEQKNQLRALIAQWRAAHPEARAVSQVRFADFAALSRRGPEAHGSGGLFAIIGLDPLSNLDPAVRELEQTRQLAERTIYYLQRAPALLDMQVERLTYQLAVTPEAKQTLADVERLSLAAEAFGELTTAVPAIIANERQALISELTAALRAEQGRIRALLAELREVLNAGARTSDSVGATVAALDSFVVRFRPQQDRVRAPSPARRPFDITEYAQTARELASAAQGAQTLLVQLDSSSTNIERLASRTAQGLREVVDRAFWRGIALIGVLAMATLLTTLAYRYAITRWSAAFGRAGRIL